MGQTLVIDLGDTFATLTFAADDNLDLSMENVSRLRDALKLMREEAPQAPVARVRPPRKKPAPPAEKHEDETGRPIRVWAKQNGYDIGDYGRIPDEVRDAYQKRRPLAVAQNGHAD